MRITIKSRGHEYEFFAPNNGGYVRLESGQKIGTLAPQICDGGEFMGSTLSCGPGEDSLKKCARKWLRQRAATLAEYGDCDQI